MTKVVPLEQIIRPAVASAREHVADLLHEIIGLELDVLDATRAAPECDADMNRSSAVEHARRARAAAYCLREALNDIANALPRTR